MSVYTVNEWLCCLFDCLVSAQEGLNQSPTPGESILTAFQGWLVTENTLTYDQLYDKVSKAFLGFLVILHKMSLWEVSCVTITMTQGLLLII